MTKHQEMENTICKRVSEKLMAADGVTENNVVATCNEICKELAIELGLRYYLVGERANLLFYDDDWCVKVDFLNNPQVQVIGIREDTVKTLQEFGSNIWFD